MIKRIYINNFRCLDNFEMKLDRINLLVGENGSGKSTVFEVLYRLQRFLKGDAKVLEVFPSTELTRWSNNRIQIFELDLQTDRHLYTYMLNVEHDENLRKARVLSETLTIGGKPLFAFKDGKAQLFHDDHKKGPECLFNWENSGISTIQSRNDNTKLIRFRNEIEKLIVLKINPQLMNSESREEDSNLHINADNFASWYRYLTQEHQGSVTPIFQSLKNVFPNFDSCSLKESGEVRIMKVQFELPSRMERVLFDLKELSDGQKVLIALYSILFGLKDSGASLFLDEPDNYMALREIQPWLMSLADLCGNGIEQAILISHHPEIIDYLADSKGKWFERVKNGPIRVLDQPPTLPDSLKTSESIARGWTSCMGECEKPIEDILYKGDESYKNNFDDSDEDFEDDVDENSELFDDDSTEDGDTETEDMILSPGANGRLRLPAKLVREVLGLNPGDAVFVSYPDNDSILIERQGHSEDTGTTQFMYIVDCHYNVRVGSNLKKKYKVMIDMDENDNKFIKLFV